jgi:hypothetical protein
VHYVNAGAFLLAPMELVQDRRLRLETALSMMKTKLVVRPAWEIEHDPDSADIHADNEPVIPEGLEGVPVLGALARARELQRSS